MDSEGSRMMEVAALGRSFSLGMLYDCRQDSLIPGFTLWDCDELEKNKRERPQPNSEFEIVASESIENKSSALDVGASLKASFLGGLVAVEGSAKYLNDQKKSKNQARVTLKYKTTTKFEELSMSHLGRGNVKHPYVFEKNLATHVVTGILYGAQAFFVFDQEKSEQESLQDIQGNLKVMIEKIPHLSIEGEEALKKEDKDNERIKKFSCKFYGDFNLNKPTTTFQDAVEVYQSLPTLLGPNKEKAVPMKVWLLPLTNLDSSAAKLVREISVRLVQEVQDVLEELSELDMRCSDALTNNITQQFPQLSKKLGSFKQMCSKFMLDFQQELVKKLPLIRGGGEEESELIEILKKRQSSPFNSRNLNEWMDCKERENIILKSYISKMKNTKIISSPNILLEEVLSAEHVVCLVFSSLGNEEPYLSALSNYLRGRSNDADIQASHTYDVEKEQWYLSNKVLEEMSRRVKLFSDFAEANQEKENMKFLTVGLTDEEHKGSTIYLYKDGFTVSQNFEPPSQPESVTAADRSHNSVTLKISPPRFGAENVTSYSVEFCVRGEDGWKQKTEARSEEVTVRELSPNTEYVFRCRAETSAGVGPAHVVPDPIKTLPCSPPGEPHIEPNSSDASVSWKKPAEISQDVQISHYILEFTERVQLKEEDLQWKQMKTSGEKMILSGLQSETEYTVRVRCDCGEAGRSQESQAVSFFTTKFTRPSERLQRLCKKINSGPPSVYQLPLTEEVKNITGCRRFTIGEKSTKPNRTIILLGSRGSGKSTLINSMINYIVGVEWEDSFRFRLIHEDHQTSEVSVYQVYHQQGFRTHHSLTIIDTPGFGDTRGTERDRKITEQLHNLFSSQNGVSEIDAVCFVVQSALAPLTQKYVFYSILSIFGKDIAENFRILVTFADGQKPPVLEGINEAGVPCPKTKGVPVHFKFNNSALFADNTAAAAAAAAGSMNDEDDDDENFDQLFWKMGTKSMKSFFSALNQINTKSLTLTKEVLRERQQLEVSIENLQIQVKQGLTKMEEIKETRKIIKEHEAEISRNEKFELEVTVTKPKKEDISGSGDFITNCQVCHVTCHYPCGIPNDDDKIKCSAMGRNGKCNVCPGKCYWKQHFNQRYRWDYKTVSEIRTIKVLKEKYQKAEGEKMTVQGVLNELMNDYNRMEQEVGRLIGESAKCLNKLKEIALKPSSFSTPDYINLLIEREKQEAKPGWKERVDSLMKMRQNAELMAKVLRGDKPLVQQASVDDQ